MPYLYTRDAVPLQILHGGIATAFAPLYIRATNETYPAAFMGHELAKDQAEVLARTVAPHLFPEEGDEPWREPIREIYKDLQETEQSFRRDRNAAAAGNWTATQVWDSLTDLLDNVQHTLDELEDLL